MKIKVSSEENVYRMKERQHSSISKQNESYPLLIAFGNPILDVTCKLNDDAILRKYNLKANHQCEIPPKEIEQIKTDALKANGGLSSTNPGGSSLNTARILAALLHPENQVMYCGTIGNDNHGQILTKLLKKSSVLSRLEVLPEHPTGNCLGLVWGEFSCLIADIGAAMHYRLDHIENISADLNNANFIYVEGYFIPNRYEVCEYLLNVCRKNGSIFIMNLSAAYICKNYQKECKTLAQSADAVFGNIEQFLELGKIYNTSTMDDIAKNLLLEYNMMEKKNVNFMGKWVVATDGPKAIELYYRYNGEIEHETFVPPTIPSANLVDTTGAGDAFVAGFLWAFLQRCPLIKCVESGASIATDIIKNIGVNLSDDFTTKM